MPEPEKWLIAAEDNLVASIELGNSGRWRSACSRAYYAAHNAGQAVVAALEPGAISSRGNLRHGELPWRLHRALAKIERMARPQVEVVRHSLAEAYNARVQADYRPESDIGREHFAIARRAAEQMLRLARRVLQ